VACRRGTEGIKPWRATAARQSATCLLIQASHAMLAEDGTGGTQTAGGHLYEDGLAAGLEAEEKARELFTRKTLRVGVAMAAGFTGLLTGLL
jgi:hypothetical protein